MATLLSKQRYSLLSSDARVQVPWIKVTIGNYTFGVFTKATRQDAKNNAGYYKQAYGIQYPNYIQKLSITKINGQVNQYTLNIVYPVRDTDDPNFFEKVFSSVSSTRKIIFTYGDAAMPSYVYKDEEAIITSVSSSFNIVGSTISYTVSATSTSTLSTLGSFSFISPGVKKPSDVIKELFRNSAYGLKKTFTGMSEKNLSTLIAGDDKAVQLDSKTNTSVLNYISYLVSCMVPAGTATGSTSKDIYILTIHDDTIYDQLYDDSSIGGPYFQVKRTSYASEQSDAYEIDVGYNTSTIVTDFSVSDDESYALYYDYQGELSQEEYVRRINKNGYWEDIFAPTVSSRNDDFETRTEDVTWWTKITKYPISASITVQGLLRPATLMSYVRLNVIFPGGHKHISSGLYIITKQVDSIDGNGYKTQLSMTRISGDSSLKTNASS